MSSHFEKCSKIVLEAAVVDASPWSHRHPCARVRTVGDDHRQCPRPDDSVVELDLHPGRPITDRHPDRSSDRRAVTFLESLGLAKHRGVHPDRPCFEERASTRLADIDPADDPAGEDRRRGRQVTRDAEHPGDVHDRPAGQHAERRFGSEELGCDGTDRAVAARGDDGSVARPDGVSGDSLRFTEGGALDDLRLDADVTKDGLDIGPRHLVRADSALPACRGIEDDADRSRRRARRAPAHRREATRRALSRR